MVAIAPGHRGLSRKSKIMSTRVLRYLSAVTWCVDDVNAAVSAWRDLLGFEQVYDDVVSDAEAQAWDALHMPGCRTVTLRAAGGDPVYIRFIETGERHGFESPATSGWMATELLVRDPDALAGRLEQTLFTRLAGPGDLFAGPKSPRAMQAIGPNGELIYFTRILPGGSRYGMKQAQAEVDRPFIVTIAGNSIDSMQGFYGEQLGMRLNPPMQFINDILAHACGAKPDTVFPTAITPIPGRRFLIEMDEFPAGVPPRPRRPGRLPPGMSMVSLRVRSLEPLASLLRAEPVPLPGAIYAGCRVGVIEGAAGEWLELIEDPGC